jgi:hypothetical protein
MMEEQLPSGSMMNVVQQGFENSERSSAMGLNLAATL